MKSLTSLSPEMLDSLFSAFSNNNVYSIPIFLNSLNGKNDLILDFYIEKNRKVILLNFCFCYSSAQLNDLKMESSPGNGF